MTTRIKTLWGDTARSHKTDDKASRYYIKIQACLAILSDVFPEGRDLEGNAP